jgi:hypothetical protein
MSKKTSISANDIEILLIKWHDAKEKIAELQKRVEKYKKLADKIMDVKGEDVVVTNDFTLRRRDMTRTTITKQDVPSDIWNEYCHKCTFKTYYLTQNK